MAKKSKVSIGRVITYSIVTIILTVAMIFGLTLVFKNINLGLDLKGGFEILYEVESLNGGDLTSDELSSTRKTLGRRIDGLGVTEPNIDVELPNRIRIQLAGITNPDDARNMLGKTANLSFRDVNDKLLMTAEVLDNNGAKVGSGNRPGSIAVVLTIKDIDTFASVTKKISEMPAGENLIVTWLDFEEGKDSYSQYKDKCNGEDGSKCISSAQVSESLSSRTVTIEGNFTEKEASNLKELINSGSLPTKLNEVSSKTVNASFGDDSLNKTLIAGVIGVALIIVVMICLYRFCGFISGVSIIIYTFLTFLFFYLIGGTLTLPGIAALVIGIGMAVDSNVISFERIKDELYQGRNLETAFINGNKSSLITILDANLTTLIVAIILFMFGESSVKGFATMFIINIIVTLVVMFLITRLITKIFVKTNYFNDKLGLFIGAKKKYISDITKSNNNTYQPFKKVDFVKRTKVFFIATVILLILASTSFVMNGFNLGIDYLGGSNISLKVDAKHHDEIKKYLSDEKYTIVKEDTISEGLDFKLKEVLSKEQIIKVSKDLNDKYQAKTDVSVISNEVKKELTKNAIIAVILGCIGIIIYVTIRYQFKYAISAIVALVHDVLIVLGVFSLFKLEVSSIIVAALLAIIGYSVNDTIVSFDRIRENLRDKNVKTKEELTEIVNKSLREVFLRSIYTTLTTLIPVVILILFGSGEIFLFNIALFVGLIAGAYSSLFVASQLWLILEKRSIGSPKKKKWYDDVDEIDELKVKGINS